MYSHDTPPPIPFIRELCSHKSEEEILEAEENFRALLRVFDRMYARLKAEETASASDREALTD